MKSLATILILIYGAGLADDQSDYMAFIDFTARYSKSYASKDLHDNKFEVF